MRGFPDSVGSLAYSSLHAYEGPSLCLLIQIYFLQALECFLLLSLERLDSHILWLHKSDPKHLFVSLSFALYLLISRHSLSLLHYLFFVIPSSCIFCFSPFAVFLISSLSALMHLRLHAPTSASCVSGPSASSTSPRHSAKRRIEDVTSPSQGKRRSCGCTRSVSRAWRVLGSVKTDPGSTRVRSAGIYSIPNYLSVLISSSLPITHPLPHQMHDAGTVEC